MALLRRGVARSSPAELLLVQQWGQLKGWSQAMGPGPHLAHRGPHCPFPAPFHGQGEKEAHRSEMLVLRQQRRLRFLCREMHTSPCALEASSRTQVTQLSLLTIESRTRCQMGERRERWIFSYTPSYLHCPLLTRVCVCVCMRERERERRLFLFF